MKRFLLLAAFLGLTCSVPAQIQAEPKPEETIDLGGGVTMEFILIRPGTFLMGSTADEGKDTEKPVHKVTITKPFYLGKHLVSQEQWQSVMHTNPSQFKGPKLPAETISWNLCQTFASKLHEKIPDRTFRLPTEAEWEYACRAGTTNEFSFGDDDSKLGEYAWFSNNSDHQTHPVGMKKPNPWGLFDMHSNVKEWCQDWFGRYDAADATDPVGPASGIGRVWRGGAFDATVVQCRSARRRLFDPDYGYIRCGVRVVMEAR